MSLVARSKEKWLFSEATQTAVQNEREGDRARSYLFSALAKFC